MEKRVLTLVKTDPFTGDTVYTITFRDGRFTVKAGDEERPAKPSELFEVGVDAPLAISSVFTDDLVQAARSGDEAARAVVAGKLRSDPLAFTLIGGGNADWVKREIDNLWRIAYAGYPPQVLKEALEELKAIAPYQTVLLDMILERLKQEAEEERERKRHEKEEERGEEEGA